MGTPKVTIKIIYEELKDLKGLIIQNKKDLSNLQDFFQNDLHTALNKISHNDKLMQDCKNAVKMVVHQNDTFQKISNEDYLIVISYKKERNEPSYCENVLGTFISKNDIIGYEIIFSNDQKTLFRVKLANRFKVNFVLKQKSCLRGRPLYIHRPYTDSEKQTRSKQIQQAKDIAKSERFKMIRNKLYICDNVYEWSTEIEGFVLMPNEHEKMIDVPICSTNSCEISVDITDENISVASKENSGSSSNAKPANNVDENQVTIADLMKRLISMDERCNRITSTASELVGKMDSIDKKCKRILKPPS